MEYNTIIAVRRKRPEVLSGEDAFICDNENYTLTFQFDDEWTEHATKTVLFVMPGGKCVAVLMEGDSCRVPRVTRPGTLYIGVKAGSVLKTTEPIGIPVNRSAQTLCGGYSATIPPDLAQQIIERMDEQEAANAEAVERLLGEIADKLDADKLLEAINTALAQAKESGEFDGDPGISPHIGDNGNWFVGNTDTGVQAQGEDYVLTEFDKIQIVAIVLSVLPKYNGEVEDV